MWSRRRMLWLSLAVYWVVAAVTYLAMLTLACRGELDMMAPE
jgi:hypothetical protein